MWTSTQAGSTLSRPGEPGVVKTAVSCAGRAYPSPRAGFRRAVRAGGWNGDRRGPSVHPVGLKQATSSVEGNLCVRHRIEHPHDGLRAERPQRSRPPVIAVATTHARDLDGRAHVARSLVARAGVLPISAVAMLLTARTVVAAIGSSGYAVAALVATLPLLIPVTDLGVGAAVTTSMAEQRHPEDVHRTLVTTLRVLVCVGLAFAAGGVAIAAASLWAPILGLPPSASVEWTVAASLALFGLSVPLGIGPRVLLGLGLNHLSILLQGVVAPLVLAISLVGRATGAGLWLFASAPAMALLAQGLVSCRVAARRGNLDLRSVGTDALNRSIRGAKVRHLAGPMAVISASLPIAYQSDRLILSHVSTLTEVTIYSAGAGLFSPMLAVVASSGQSLWPLFARARTQAPDRLRSLFLQACRTFVGLGLVLAAGLVVLGPKIATWTVHAQVIVPIGVMGAFALLVFVQALYYPTGMLLMDQQGLRLQAVTSVAMAVVNVCLSVYLATRLGAAGPILGSALSILVCMGLPGFRLARKRIRLSRDEVAS